MSTLENTNKELLTNHFDKHVQSKFDNDVISQIDFRCIQKIMIGGKEIKQVINKNNIIWKNKE